MSLVASRAVESDRRLGEPLTLGQFGRVVLSHWVLIVAGTVLGALAGFGVAQILPPVYSATAIELVKGIPGKGVAANYDAAQYSVGRAKAYPSFLYNATVLEGVHADVGGSESVADLKKDLTATNPAETPLVQITAVADSPQLARDKANSAARHLAILVTQVETTGGTSPITMEPAVPAGAPIQPDSPRPLLFTALGAVAGLALALAIALVHAYVRSARSRKQGPRWAQESEGMPAVSARPAVSEPTTAGLSAPSGSDSIGAMSGAGGGEASVRRGDDARRRNSTEVPSQP